MSLLRDRDIEAALPQRASDLDRDPAPEGGGRSGPEARTDLEARSTAGEVRGAWSAVTGAGRRGGHPGMRGWVSRLQSAAGNAAVAGLLGPRADLGARANLARADDARATRRVGPTLRHAGGAGVPGSEPDAAVPLETDAPVPLDDEAAAPAPTSSFTKVGPPTLSPFTVSGTLREAANAVAARPEAGATIATPDMVTGDGWPSHVQVTVTQVVELPEWDGKAAATQGQRNEWDRFKAAITAHENGHVAIDKNVYANAHAKIRAKKTKEAAYAEYDTIAAKDDADNKLYDGDAHGRPATNINPNIDEVTKVP